MKKVFNEKGDLVVRFASDSKDQIVKWLDGVDYDYAIKFAKEVDCPVFVKALEFPCIFIDEEEKLYIPTESYSERLERECEETDKMFPVVKKIVDKILLINRISNMEFDYMIERKNMMYEAVKKNLNLASDLDIEKWAASKVNGIDPGEYGYGDMLIMGAKAMRDGEIKSIEDK